MPCTPLRLALLTAGLGVVLTACGSESGAGPGSSGSSGSATASAPNGGQQSGAPAAAAVTSPCATRGAGMPDKDDFCTAVTLAPQDGGLQAGDISPGSGPGARKGQKLSVQYTGWLANGTMFDSSRTRGQAFTFTLGNHEVIQGWDSGLVGVRAGGKRRLMIPPALGYGSQGAGGVIPPDATLVFDIEVVSISG